nr:somatic embryogenesis receptor kinase 2 [Ipomoea trifida]GLL49599.1 somatic embryogenesis receptor kinase 2 [Ipomoea trifida]
MMGVHRDALVSLVVWLILVVHPFRLIVANMEGCRNKEFQQSVKELKEKAEELKGVKEDLKTSLLLAAVFTILDICFEEVMLLKFGAEMDYEFGSAAAIKWQFD